MTRALRSSLPRLVVLAGVAAIVLGCGRSSMFECEHGLRDETRSPDGRFKAAILDVQCGATTSDATWVLLTEAGKSFRDEQDRVATFDGSVRRLLWEEGTLVVIHGDAKPAMTSESARDVRIVYRTDDGRCPRVDEIKTMPFRDDRGVDASYDRLRFDDACESVLIGSLDNTQKMADPRQMPPDPRFAVADAALFVLLERRSLAVEDVLPADVVAQMKDRGIYAYFDYVAAPGGRSAVVDRIKRLIAQ